MFRSFISLSSGTGHKYINGKLCYVHVSSTWDERRQNVVDDNDDDDYYDDDDGDDDDDDNDNNNNNMKITNETWTHPMKVVSLCIKSHQHN